MESSPSDPGGTRRDKLRIIRKGSPEETGKEKYMLEYHAAYYKDEESGWFAAEILDFPGALSQGRTLRSARRNLRDALRLMAECLVERRQSLPSPNPRARDKRADFEETIQLKIRFLAGVTS